MALRSFNLIIPKKAVALLITWSIVFPAVSQRLNILFVGNSLTYSNNLPELVKKIAKCDNTEVTYRTLAFPNYALEDHIHEGRVITEIKSGGYDFVIVQQGPSSQQEGRHMLLTDGLKLAKLCAKSKSKLAFFTVWPAKERFGDFPRVIESYQLAADSAEAVLCPVGKAWLKAWESNAVLSLYSEDNFHPGYRGTLLAALVIYGSIMKKETLDFVSYNVLRQEDLSRTDFEILQQAAQQTLLAEAKRGKHRKRYLNK